MASTSRDGKKSGVESIQEEDGSVTARDLETGLARGGETRVEALVQLAELLRLAAGSGKSIDDPDDFLEAEIEIDVGELEEHDEIAIGTLRSIADQRNVDDFEAWCAWIDEHA